MRERRKGFGVPRRAVALLTATALLSGLVLLVPGRARAVENAAYADALAQLDSITSAYEALSLQQDATYAQLEEVQVQIADNEAEAEGVQRDIEASQARLAEQQKVLAAQIHSEYKTGGVNLLSILLSSTTFEEAISKVHYHNAVCQREAEAIAAVKDTKASLQSQQNELEGIKQELLKQQEDIEGLLGQQRQQADEMYQQQLEAATLVQSLPREVQETLDDDVEELVNESQAAIHADELNAQEGGETAASTDASQGQQGATSSDTGTKTQTPAQTTKSPTTNGNQSSTTSQSTKTNTNTSTSTTTKTTTPQPETKSQVKEESTPAPAQEAPASNGTLQALVNTAYATGPTRADWGCSGWVYVVFKTAGISKFSGTAASFYNNWCYSSDRSQLMPGMVIAVNNTGGSAAGRMYGHVGIYLGNGTVRHFTKGAVSDMNVDTWIRTYGRVCTPRWGWNGGVPLS